MTTANGSLTGFDHITIAARNLDLAVKQYRLLLGVEPSWRGQYPGVGLEGAHFRLQNAVIELIAPRAADPGADGLRVLLDAQGEGLQAVAFATDGADALRAALRERGLRAAPPEDGEARSVDGAVRRYRTLELSPRSTRGLAVFAVERLDPLPNASERAEPAAVYALDHIVIRTAEPDAAVALYRDGLGVRLALDRDFGGTRLLFFRIGGVTLEVVQDAALGPLDVFYGAAYRVRDIDSAHARLAASGLELSDVRAGNKPNTRVFTLRSGSCGVPTLILHDPARE